MIIIKSQNEIDSMRRGGKILAEVMAEVGKNIAPGINTKSLDELAERLIFSSGGTPAFKGYGEADNPFPATLCISLNNEIVHGIPSADRIIQEGDLVKIDVGMKFEGMITDMARTFEVGAVSARSHELARTTREALNEGIKKIKAGAKMSEYSEAVEGYAKSRGFSVIRDLVGHGVGKELHEDPQIPNYRFRGQDLVWKEGMTIALEPMVNEGTHYIKILEDGWTFATKDKKLSAHFEDTVLVRKSGCEILTR